MSRWIGRRHARGTASAMLSLLLLAGGFCERTLGDDNGRTSSEPLAVPRILRDPESAEIDPAIAPPTDVTRPYLDQSAKVAKGRATLPGKRAP